MPAFHYIVKLEQLYIPYGSNKTLVMGFSWICKLSFISHMVQIKLVTLYFGQAKRKYFISHMVQIKPHILTILHSVSTLYIPYGSNKTLTLRKDAVRKWCFISHMVQIKPCKTSQKLSRSSFYIPYGSNKTRVKVLIPY